VWPVIADATSTWEPTPRATQNNRDWLGIWAKGHRRPQLTVALDPYGALVDWILNPTMECT